MKRFVIMNTSWANADAVENRTTLGQSTIVSLVVSNWHNFVSKLPYGPVASQPWRSTPNALAAWGEITAVMRMWGSKRVVAVGMNAWPSS